MSQVSDRLAQIPSINAILEDRRIEPLLAGHSRDWMTRLSRRMVEGMRKELLTANGPVLERNQLMSALVKRLVDKRNALLEKSWTRVLNGTGVVVHTNLGRSCFPVAAADAAHAVACFNSDLEFDLAEGSRGHRGREVEEKISLLTGAADALVVNNNAAAVWLAVRFLCPGGRVVLSRGEVVAIGGSFRIHEILAETGCTLVEVGTTNRTSLEDYRAALGPETMVLKVHRSNFSVQGFTEDVELADLARLCRETECPLAYDAGSGAIFPYQELGLPSGERLLAEDLSAGPDLITCSGDKLLGGCQAGVILGSEKLVMGLRKHPMRRAFRVDKTTLAALDAIMSLYLAAEDRPAIPTLDQLAQDLDMLSDRAERLLAVLINSAPSNWLGSVVPGHSSVGGGTFSTASIESRLVLWNGPKVELEACHQSLRLGDPALVGRMNQEGLAVDVRTICEEELPLVEEAFRRAWDSMAGTEKTGKAK
ncbi:MAG: L-seryl-tRNA(Sec) selenium transferase [Gemmatimonadales bacterium]|nr:L-seryl-tRNA(Sec) selenium transferase [Gemmatimonadales bacterium]